MSHEKSTKRYYSHLTNHFIRKHNILSLSLTLIDYISCSTLNKPNTITLPFQSNCFMNTTNLYHDNLKYQSMINDMIDENIQGNIALNNFKEEKYAKVIDNYKTQLDNTNKVKNQQNQNKPKQILSESFNSNDSSFLAENLTHNSRQDYIYENDSTTYKSLTSKNNETNQLINELPAKIQYDTPKKIINVGKVNDLKLSPKKNEIIKTSFQKKIPIRPESQKQVLNLNSNKLNLMKFDYNINVSQHQSPNHINNKRKKGMISPIGTLKDNSLIQFSSNDRRKPTSSLSKNYSLTNLALTNAFNRNPLTKTSSKNMMKLKQQKEDINNLSYDISQGKIMRNTKRNNQSIKYMPLKTSHNLNQEGTYSQDNIKSVSKTKTKMVFDLDLSDNDQTIGKTKERKQTTTNNNHKIINEKNIEVILTDYSKQSNDLTDKVIAEKLRKLKVLKSKQNIKNTQITQEVKKNTTLTFLSKINIPFTNTSSLQKQNQTPPNYPLIKNKLQQQDQVKPLITKTTIFPSIFKLNFKVNNSIEDIFFNDIHFIK